MTDPEFIDPPAGCQIHMGPVTHRCPKCGWTGRVADCVSIYGGPHRGSYCQRCFQAFLARTIPGMQEIDAAPPSAGEKQA